jgi:restriction endonuclease
VGQTLSLGSSIPRLQRHAEFKAAIIDFEEWDVRTRSEFWRSLTGHRFDWELAALFKRQGYDVERTPGSGDHGIDIILRNSGITTEVQCKQTKHPVGPAVARELYGALIASNADAGILAVVGGVTRGVHQFFVGKPLRVMDLHEIVDLHKPHDN